MSISDESSDLFITEVDAGRKFRSSKSENEDLLVNVRKDHLKVREVVNAFRAKVDRLIDKQRHEYIQAYENHMQDVQKELHSMREKVFEIANDDTKNERTEKLKSDLDTFKDEAIQLETDADQLRVTMSSLVRKIYAVERSRDWMLKKLRQAKRKYNNLIKEKVKLLEVQSQASLSNDSSYTLEMKRQKDSTRRNNFTRELVTATRVGRNISLPSVQNVPSSSERFSQRIHGGEDGDGRPLTSISIEKHPNTLSGLVAARTTHEEVKTFVQQCSISLHKRPWCKVQRRHFNVLLQDSVSIMKDSMIEEKLVPLACELACSPETFDVLSGLLVLHFEKLPRKRKNIDTGQKNNADILNNEAILSWQTFVS